MTIRLAWVASVLLVCCGCTQHQTRFSRRKAAIAQSRVPSTPRRTLENAAQAPAGDPKLAELRRQMERSPASLAPRLELAAEYARQGFPEVAIEHYRLASERFPEESGVRILLARALRAEGLARQAVEALESFARARPECPAAVHSWIGILHDELGDFAAAEKAHREALRRDGAQDALYNNLGYNLLLQGRADDAAAQFRAALTLNRHSRVAANNLAAALAAGHAETEASARLAAATDAATAHNNLAAILMEQRRYAEARAELAAALILRRNHPAALRNLALLGELEGKPAALPAGKKRPGRAAGRDESGQERP
jgi:Flp pilus assembly protein TadD